MHAGAWRGILLVLIWILSAGFSQPESDAPIPGPDPAGQMPDSGGPVPVIGTAADGQSDTTPSDTGSLPAPAFQLTVHNFPNPLEDRTTFVLALPDRGHVSLLIFNRTGVRISTLLQNEPLEGGIHLINWNARDDRNQPVASGTYDYLLEWRQEEKTHRIRKKLVVNRQ